MIEGMKVEIPAAELVKHLRDRAEYYRDITEITKNAFEHMDATRDAFYYGVRSDMWTYQAKANRFNRLADHIIQGETYRLGEHDLKLMEWW
jgi:hypothetical protein